MAEGLSYSVLHGLPLAFVADSRDGVTVGVVKLTPGMYGAVTHRTLLFACK